MSLMVPPAVFRASRSCAQPPAWARLQRDLFDALDAAVDPYLARYTRPDGSLIHRDDWVQGRDGLDDLYEAFYNFPLLYLLGGADRLLPLSHRQWSMMTAQGAGYGLVHRDYEIGYDQFHQSEGNLLFQFLCAADPTSGRLRSLAARFADFYTGRDPEVQNYDPQHNIIRAVHTGSGGPRWGYIDTDRFWTRRMERYGLPFDDVPGIGSYDDVADWLDGATRRENGRRMIAVMNDRMGRGDSVSNLLVTSLVANAFLMTGDTAFRDWIVRYVGGWWSRADANRGLLPDNVGLSGQVGEYFGGRWYGAAYGWSWPHGYDSVVDAATVAACNAAMLTGDHGWTALPGDHVDRLLAMGRRVPDIRALPASLSDPWILAAAAGDGRHDMTVVPKRHKDTGWFDEQPLGTGNPLAIWSVTQAAGDLDRLARLEACDPHDWRVSFALRTKGDNGNDRPWLSFVQGRNPSYPETVLRQGLASVSARIAAISADGSDLHNVHIHHWQEHNPLTTEALVQLTLGGPQPVYNGGLLHTRFRHFDTAARRPGLPPDVAALVSDIDGPAAQLTLVNLSDRATRQVLVQGGFHAEHQVLSAAMDGGAERPVNAAHMRFDLPPGTIITARVTMDRGALQPTYAPPDFNLWANRLEGTCHVADQA